MRALANVHGIYQRFYTIRILVETLIWRIDEEAETRNCTADGSIIEN